MHGQQPVHHHHGRACDGQFIGKPFQLPVELMQREPSTEVEPCQTRFNLSAQRLEKRDEPCGIDSAGPVHPVDGSSLNQRMRNPMLGNTTHAFARTTRSAEVVELACLRLNLSRINAVRSANKGEVFSCDGVEVLLHINH